MEYLCCYRFDRKANEVPIRKQVIDEYLRVCENYLKDESGEVVEVEQWPPFSLRCHGFSLDLWPAFIDSRVMTWHARLANLVYSICEVGGLSVLLPKAVLIIDRHQREEVPDLWRQNREILECPDGDALFMLAKRFQFDVPLESRDYGFGMFGGPLPGCFPSRSRTIYIEALKGETPLKHQRMVYKHKHSDPSILRPESGLVRKEFWEIVTPSGSRFFAYGYGGIGWFDLLCDFAKSTNRKYGEIVNCETFSFAGEKIRIDNCIVGRVEPK